MIGKGKLNFSTSAYQHLRAGAEIKQAGENHIHNTRVCSAGLDERLSPCFILQMHSQAECSAGSGKALCCKQIPWNDPHIVYAWEPSAKILPHKCCFPKKYTGLIPPTCKSCQETCSGINISLTFGGIDEFTALLQLLNTILFILFTIWFAPMWLWSCARLIRLRMEI